jgi:hypothetical protein
MNRGRLRAVLALATGILVAALASLAFVAPVAADCGMAGPPSDLAAYRGIAFVGTVTANESIDLLRLTSRHRTQEVAVTLDVERPIRGITDDETVVIGGKKGNCSILWASELAVGDRVLISYKPRADEGGFDLAPGAHIVWYALVWRPTDDGGWRFARGSVQFPESHPAAARAADTYAEIVAQVGPGMPPTDTPPGATADDQPSLSVLLGILLVTVSGLAGGLLMLRRLRTPA